MDQQRTQFRFHPNAFTNENVFEPLEVKCEVCGKCSKWRYKGPVYGKKISNVCPECIGNGKFCTVADAVLHDIDLEKVDPEVAEEILTRTPGVACFNPYQWPVIDGLPLAFIGYGDEPTFVSCIEAQKAIKAAFSFYGWNFEEGTATPYALIFKQLDGPRYQAVIDLD